jgi:hypothetical protein
VIRFIANQQGELFVVLFIPAAKADGYLLFSACVIHKSNFYLSNKPNLTN